MSPIPRTVSYYLILYANRWVHLGTYSIKPKFVIPVKSVFVGCLRKGKLVSVKKGEFITFFYLLMIT